MTVPELDSHQNLTEAAQAERLKAIGLMCVAVSMFALLDATAKYLVGPLGMPVLQVVGLRFAVNFLLLLALMPILLGPRAAPGVVRTRKPLMQIVRSFLLFGSTIFNFFAVKYLQLDQTVTIFYAAPLLVAALAGPILGEWVGWRRMVAILAGFSGVVLVTRPGFGGIHWAVIFSFSALLCYAFYNVTTRYMARHDPTEVTMFYSPVAGLAVMLPVLIVEWVWPQDAWTWFLLFSVGFLGGLGHWLLIVAHRLAPAPVLAPFVYTNVLAMVGLGFLIFGDLPSAWTLAGGAVVIGSGLYLLYRERVRKAPATSAPHGQ